MKRIWRHAVWIDGHMRPRPLLPKAEVVRYENLKRLRQNIDFKKGKKKEATGTNSPCLFSNHIIYVNVSVCVFCGKWQLSRQMDVSTSSVILALPWLLLCYIMMTSLIILLRLSHVYFFAPLPTCLKCSCWSLLAHKSCRICSKRLSSLSQVQHTENCVCLRESTFTGVFEWHASAVI